MFETCILGSMFTYYLKTSEKNTLFPGTISFCARKGIPFYVFHISVGIG